MLESCDFLYVVVSRADVEVGDIGEALATLQLLLQSPNSMLHFFERVDISFEGYDSDPRELHQIPEVRNYVHKLDGKFPFWLFFLSKAHFGLQSLLLCFLSPHLTDEAKMRLFPDEINLVLSDRWLPAMNQVCAHIGWSDARIIELTDEVMEYITEGPTPIHG